MRFRLLVLLSSVALVVPLALVASRHSSVPEQAELSVTASRHSQKQFTTSAQFASGSANGISTANGRLTWQRAAVTRTIGGIRHGMGAWHSPWVSPGHAFTEVIPSWNARADRNAWVVVQVRGRTSRGSVSGWKNLGQWHEALGRRTFGSQADQLASAAVDTFRARPGVSFTSYQVRIELHRRHGTTSVPRVHSVHAVASRIGGVPAVSRPLLGAKALTLPSYSQMIHRGEYPQYGGGGQAWCSPTSLSMILGYYGALPTSREYAWVDSRYRDRWVDHVARQVYDAGYEGAGNWAFNTAYAATRLPEAMVTRLPNLRHVEKFIARGIPVQVSISFGSGQLAGAPISATNGHLVVVRGFTRAGNVLVNDPAAPDNGSVRRVYDRAQFERAWLGKSHGTAYLVRGAGRTFPPGYTG